ncbi:DUF6477 family protein [Paracoccus xiamenensis]|uniref:DUF6477 family protein n=1 Tax=Paracoccus xiamenensis TaxID=2714901 RepID=UPI001A980A3A|nr:DUF6477 family protein [Paracoccus xiamenensis]
MSFMTDPAIFDLASAQAPLRRPATLIRAARAGQAGWRRDRDLPRLLGRETLPSNPAALRMLRAAESAADSARREGRADYDMHRHVRLIIALLAEMRLQAEMGPLAAGNVIAFSGRGKARPARRA